MCTLDGKIYVAASRIARGLGVWVEEVLCVCSIGSLALIAGVITVKNFIDGGIRPRVRV